MGWEYWKAIKEEVEKTKPKQIFAAFKKGLEISDTYWTSRVVYHSDVKQGIREIAAKLAV